MHYRLLVTTQLPPDATSEDARQAVYDALLTDDSFCGSGGRYGSPLCDWFVIGGRWSGLLAEIMIGSSFKDAVQARFPELAREWWPEAMAVRHATELDTLWHKHGGTGPSPYTRSGYEELGHADDAMLITPCLYEGLLAEYQGQDLSRGDYVDLDCEALHPDFIGRKWLIVVDYHN